MNKDEDQHLNPTIFVSPYESSFVYESKYNNKNHRVMSNIPFPDLLNPNE
jgi:hypothetical protein